MAKMAGWGCINSGEIRRSDLPTDNDAISAVMFGFIQGIVRFFDQVGEGICDIGFCNTCADRDLEMACIGDERLIHDGLAQAFGDDIGSFIVRFRQEDNEFLATIPADEVCGPRVLMAAPCQILKYLISSLMAVFIIDLFKMIEVEHHHTEWTIDAAGALEFILP